MKKRILCCLLMLCMVITMAPAMAWAGGDGDGVILYIEDGDITIDSSGYTQGTGEPTSWSDTSNKALTIASHTPAEASANTVTVDNSGETPILITLQNLNITATNKPAIDLKNGTTRFILNGNNVINQNTDNLSAINVRNAATLEITDGTNGSLTATSGNNAAGIGGCRKTLANDWNDKNIIWGTIHIMGGSVITNGAGKASGLGGGTDSFASEVTISNGDVRVKSGTNSNAPGIKANTVNMNGGKVSVEGRSAGIQSTTFKMSGGTLQSISVDSEKPYIDASTVSITGGNVNGYYTKGIEGRILTELYFSDADTEAPLANTEVSVTEGSQPWTAVTDAKGVITTYLSEGTSEISVQVGEASSEGIALQDRNGQKVALIGAQCICDPNTAIQWSGVDAATIYKGMGELTVAEEPQFIKAANCVAPVHPGYDILKVTIEKVTVDGTAVDAGEIAEYASYSDGTLTLTEKTKDYTVTLKAASENGLITSSYDIAVTVDSTVKGFYIANGNITVTAADNGQVKYTQGLTEILADASEEVAITGTAEANIDGNTILVDNCSPTIRLKDVTVKFTTDSTAGNKGAYYSAIKISGDSHATIVLEGTNKLFEANRSYINRGINGIELNSTDKDKPAKITIKCAEENGASECSDDNCPHKLYVYSEISPGIGYGAYENSEQANSIHYFEVNIEGGQVIGEGTNFSALIGGGWYQQIGFDFNMTGGYVYAERPGTEGSLIGFGRFDPDSLISLDSYVNLNVTGGKIKTKISEIGVANAGKPTILANSVNIGGDAVVDVQGEIKGNVALEGNGCLNITEIPGEVDRGSSILTYPGNITGSLTVTGDAAANLGGCVTEETRVSGSDASLSVGKDGGPITIENGATVTLPSGDAVTFPETIGSVTIPAGKLNEVEVKQDGSISLPAGSTVNGVEIPTGTGTVTLPADKVDQVSDSDDGSVNLPAGTVISKEDGTVITLPSGGSVSIDGNPSSSTGNVITENADGTVTVTDKNSNTTTINPPGGSKVEIEENGTVKIPAGSTVTDKNGNTTTMTNGGTVTSDGTVIKKPSGGGYYPITPSQPEEQQPEEPNTDLDEEQAKIERIINGVESTTIVARSSKTAKGIKITWTKSKGYKVDYFEIYRSTKKDSFSKKPFYTTKSSKAVSYTNTKDLKGGTKYYYMVRGVRVIDGQKYYTEWSTKAIRTW